MDYEALGRYTEAKERASRLNAERARHISEIRRLTDRIANTPDPSYLGSLDTVKFQELALSITALSDQLNAAIADANAVAQKADRQLLRLQP